ncbi:bifunctional phosphopantothenoylcysteine decarboxylase/phosphopantothenate--cysteine ligase CoaBC [Candidatus Sordicultor fermentans]|uniref:bifunctional phosphopantothenoylcysteine decarboxylase/phosphopantothenate--cysteine ligase CoaBC n=1 Tax=Candidatus Sordicultor fermentans TaxID=1953203 RepID=UPI0016A08EF7|nr:bifunctional phosphopantothenoylcysteine decarboxylase/phosphopantothenate--cysteine ligase CoaBC [Atribacterota bacterium]NLY05871.1 bifunctional phosphopantothenoylcysteine decarboxylase/phosphopantothenate--cysteine ligase CoaBC [Candidatus Atribacteria bacterium]HOA99178.1 bifunctional phosphopantothenoylcysteine decarboxylase/phosphopantothenate--cysteine ligase CoaBC [Candidatus Atribacteria bacterium]
MIVYHPTQFWKGKKIVLGVTGGIAAFKAISLASYFTKAGARVKTCLTENALSLVGKSSFEAVTRERAYVGLFEGGGEILHIDLVRESDAVIVVPATANILGKAASGIGDDLLSTILLVDPSKVILAPAMNVTMWKNPVVQDNLEKVVSRGMKVIYPASGSLACGEEGEGRLPELEELVEGIFYHLYPRTEFQGKKVLISAGATREWLDPARFISNPASGFMGGALASLARACGGEVKMVVGNVSSRLPSGVEIERVETAQEMEIALKREWGNSDILFMNAAVSDFRPLSFSPSKIKKEGKEELTLTLVKNPDILSELAKNKGNKIVVGFCAETDNPQEEARKKLQKKNADIIVANLIACGESGFETSTNKAWIVDCRGGEKELPLLDKRDLAEEIVSYLFDHFRG